MHTHHEGTEQLQAAASALLVPLRVTAATDADFTADIESGSAGPVVVARIRGAPHVVSRRARLITSTDRDLFKVTLHHQGSATVRQAGREGRARAGGLVVLDTARPYELAVTGPCDVTVIGMPRALLGAHADLLAQRTALPLASDTGTQGVVAGFLAGLGEAPRALPGARGIHLGEALASLLIAAFTDTTAERADVGADLADRIVAYVLANLGDPDLCVESVARRHGISPRHLHRLFRRRGDSFAAWLRHERLRRIRRDLLDPALAHRTTAAIAGHWGIHDPRHIGRALKAEFGQNAAEIRRSARQRQEHHLQGA